MRKLASLFAGLLMAGLAVAQPGSTPAGLHLKGLNRDLAAPSAATEVRSKTRTLGRSHMLVQFAEYPSDDQLNELRKLGATVLSYVPDNAFSISVNDGVSLDGDGVQAVGRLQPKEKISPDLAGALVNGATVTAIAEFYGDVNPNDARAIVNDAGLLIEQNPDLLSNHLLILGRSEQVHALSGWDEVAYIFPASEDLIARRPVHSCAGALTQQGAVAQSVALVGAWNGSGLAGANLNYSFVHLTDTLPADSVESEIVRAFSEWAKYAKLTFTETSDSTANQTIAVLFASGDHGDGYPFVPQGGVLAHTFYPFPVNPESIAGHMHFNNDESWNIGADVDVFSIALHEAGHALGLGHSDNPSAVMYPYYHEARGLSQEDISAILQLYAAQDGQPQPGVPSDPPTPTSPTPPNPAPTPTPTNPIPGPTPTNPTPTNPTPTNPAPNPTPANPTPGPDTTPPSITILSPATTNFATSASSLVIQGTAKDNVGVALVTWASSNGGSGTASGTNNWTTPAIPLYVGETTITIRASDAAGNASWRSLTVTRN